MNSDQLKGAAKNAAGKLQQNVGKAVGSKKQEAKGLVKQAEGKLQEELGAQREATRKRRNEKAC